MLQTCGNALDAAENRGPKLPILGSAMMSKQHYILSVTCLCSSLLVQIPSL